MSPFYFQGHYYSMTYGQLRCKVPSESVPGLDTPLGRTVHMGIWRQWAIPGYNVFLCFGLSMYLNETNAMST